ncbi:hypothetical protein AB7M16_004172 [Bradyrhizobium sp. USDA 372]
MEGTNAMMSGASSSVWKIIPIVLFVASLMLAGLAYIVSSSNDPIQKALKETKVVCGTAVQRGEDIILTCRPKSTPDPFPVKRLFRPC